MADYWSISGNKKDEGQEPKKVNLPDESAFLDMYDIHIQSVAIPIHHDILIHYFYLVLSDQGEWETQFLSCVHCHSENNEDSVI